MAIMAKQMMNDNLNLFHMRGTIMERISPQRPSDAGSLPSIQKVDRSTSFPVEPHVLVT